MNRQCKLDKAFSKMRIKYGLSKTAQNLLELVLSKYPEHRPTPAQALNHPWFSKEREPLRSLLHMNRLLTNKFGVVAALNANMASQNREDFRKASPSLNQTAKIEKIENHTI